MEADRLPCQNSDESYFRNTSPSEEPSDNWVLRFSALKRLYRLMSQYFPDVLQKSMASLEVPNLQAIAKDSDPAAILALCRLTVVIGVQCEKNKEFIEKIQGLNESDQHVLMRAIEQVCQCRNLCYKTRALTLFLQRSWARSEREAWRAKVEMHQ